MVNSEQAAALLLSTPAVAELAAPVDADVGGDEVKAQEDEECRRRSSCAIEFEVVLAVGVGVVVDDADADAADALCLSCSRRLKRAPRSYNLKRKENNNKNNKRPRLLVKEKDNKDG